MAPLLQFEAVLGNRTAPTTTPPPPDKVYAVVQGWAIKPSPEHHPHKFWLWNLHHNYWTGTFCESEAERAIKLLGDATRYPDHGAAMSAINAGWASITSQRVRGVA